MDGCRAEATFAMKMVMGNSAQVKNGWFTAYHLEWGGKVRKMRSKNPWKCPAIPSGSQLGRQEANSVRRRHRLKDTLVLKMCKDTSTRRSPQITLIAESFQHSDYGQFSAQSVPNMLTTRNRQAEYNHLAERMHLIEKLFQTITLRIFMRYWFYSNFEHRITSIAFGIGLELHFFFFPRVHSSALGCDAHFSVSTNINH